MPGKSKGPVTKAGGAARGVRFAPKVTTSTGKALFAKGLTKGAAREKPVDKGPQMPPSYFELVSLFPLIRIRDEGHLTLALKMINKLLRTERDEGAEAYLSVLTDLVETYEDEHEPAPEASEADVLASLMEANGLSQRGLAERVGIAQSTISAVLQGKRALTRGQIKVLADSFGLTPAAFIGG